jgi:hypothetical protein
MLRQEGARDLEEREERERMYGRDNYHASMLRQESARDLEKREERERMYEWEKYHASMLRQKVERDLEEVEMKGNGWKNDTSYLMFKERLKRDMGLRDLVVEWRRWRNHYFAKKCACNCWSSCTLCEDMLAKIHLLEFLMNQSIPSIARTVKEEVNHLGSEDVDVDQDPMRREFGIGEFNSGHLQEDSRC